MEITRRCFCYYYQTNKDKDLLPFAGLNPMFFSCQDKRSYMIWLRLIPVCSVFLTIFAKYFCMGVYGKFHLSPLHGWWRDVPLL